MQDPMIAKAMQSGIPIQLFLHKERKRREARRNAFSLDQQRKNEEAKLKRDLQIAKRKQWIRRMKALAIEREILLMDTYFAGLEQRKSLREIMIEVCAKHQVSVLDIMSGRRVKPIVLARQEYYYRARMETIYSYPTIGKFCGGKDHTTVIYGARKHAESYGLPQPPRVTKR